MSRFDFIRFKDKKLYDLCVQVEERIYDSQDIFTLKCRRALEYIVFLTGAKGNNLYEKILDIENNLTFPPDIQRDFFSLKDICNENIHINHLKQSNIDVYEVIHKLELICHWLIDAIAKKRIDIKIETNLKELEKITLALKNAFKRNDYNSIIQLIERIKNLAQDQTVEINNFKQYDDTLGKCEAEKIVRKDIEGIKNLAQNQTVEISDFKQYDDTLGKCEAEKIVRKDIDYLVNNLNAYIKNGYPHIMQAAIDDLKENIELALKGDTNGLFEIANLYRFKDSGFPFLEVNYTKAIDYLELASHKGSIYALSSIGELYYDKIEDFEKAYHWSILAAKRGDDVSQFRIGQMYYYGKGVEQDFEKALEWYNKAKSNGHPYANRAIINILKKLGYSSNQQ